MNDSSGELMRRHNQKMHPFSHATTTMMRASLITVILFIVFSSSEFVGARNVPQQAQQAASGASPAKRNPISATFQPTSARQQVASNSAPQQQPPVISRNQHQYHAPQPATSASYPTANRQQQQLQQGNRVPYYSTPAGAGRRNSNQFSICRVPENLLHLSRCRADRESAFPAAALAEFRSKLEETSLDLRRLIDSYWDEFHNLSLDLILVAKNKTLSRLLAHPEHHEATRRLFDSMHLHLASYESSTLELSPTPHRAILKNLAGLEQMGAQTGSSTADINQEIASYFRRLYLIQVKRSLDLKASNGDHDLECLENNLKSQEQIDKMLLELAPPGSNPALAQRPDQAGSNLLAHSGPQLGALSLDQLKLTVSIKQSLEFARVLTSALTLARDMFAELTVRVAEWIPHSECRSALARMLVCQECHPIGLQPGGHQLSSLSGANRWPAQQATIVGHATPLEGGAQAPPCEGYCLNLARGCMNDLHELNRFWASHVSALAAFRTNIIQTNNIENVMSNLDERLISFMTKLHQQYNSSTINTSSMEQFDGAKKSAEVSIEFCVKGLARG